MAEIYVTSTADSGAGSLRAAISAAQDGDVILFDSDVFPDGQTTSILLSSYITVDKSVSIYGGFSDGNGGYTGGASKRYYVYREVEGVKTKTYIDDENPALDGETLLFELVCRVALDGQEAAPITRFSSRKTLTCCGVEYKNGYAANGGGAYHYGYSETTWTECQFSDCVATASAGAVRSDADAVCVFNDCVFNNCSTTGSNYAGAVITTQHTHNTFNNCISSSCNAQNGGGFYLTGSSVNDLIDCVFVNCSCRSGGGALYTNTSSQNSIIRCVFDSCSAGSSGGAVYAYTNSQNVFDDCIFNGCTSVYNGAGLYVTLATQNVLNNCVITNCEAQGYGGGFNAMGTSQNTLTDCVITGNKGRAGGGGCYLSETSSSTFNVCKITDNESSNTISSGDVFVAASNVAIFNNAKIGRLRSHQSSSFSLSAGITSIDVATLVNSNGVAPTITIADGAALTITTAATIGATTFTSDGRGYLSVAPGINTSSATLTNVVLCAYGADVSSFAEVDGVLEWDADDPSVSVLIEREVNDAWTTLAQTTGESLDYYLPPKVNLRLFDGERFLTTATPDSRTYFYIGGAEGSFDDAEDWSLTKDGTAIPQSPTITDCAFVIQGAEGDVAISKGSANVTNATIIPAGTNDVSVVVDEATVLAGTERFTGTLTTTGDVTITGDASKLAIVVDGTLEVAGSLKLATVTLTSGSSVVFASADDVLVVTDSATVNDATFSCEEPTAYFTAPVGTDLTQATFTNVYVATKGAEVESVTGSRFGKNYSINIISEDNTLPVTVEYRLEGTTEWIVADPAFVGTTFQIRLDDEATFRVYNGEKFTEATMKVYGLYNEMAAIVEIGYLI